MTPSTGSVDAASLAALTDLLRRTGRTVECSVHGDSMGDAVPDGALARIRCDGAPDAAPGTVVALMLGGALTIHRLVHRGRSPRARGWVVTAGDGNLTCDAPMRTDRILGEVESLREMDGPWRPPSPARRRGVRAIPATGSRLLVCAALEIHPRVARWMKALIVLLTTPLVWLRPYPAGAIRSASIAHLDP